MLRLHYASSIVKQWQLLVLNKEELYPLFNLFVMLDYVFWPINLLKREDDLRQRGDELVAIGIKSKDSGFVVLDIYPVDNLKGVKIRVPYYVIGRSDANSLKSWPRNWQFELEKYGVDESYLVKFKEPKLKLMEFYSLEPLSLELPEKVVENSTNEGEDLQQNAMKLWSHPRFESNDRKLRDSIVLINIYFKQLRKLHADYPSLRREFENKPTLLINKFKSYIFSTKIWKFIRTVLYYIALIICACATSVLTILNRHIPQIINISATAQQIDLRCRQYCYFPVQYLKISRDVNFKRQAPRIRSNSVASALQLRDDLPFENYPDYIRMYNTVWLIFNDLSFGFMLTAYLYENGDYIVDRSSRFIQWSLYEALKVLTQNLARNPFGIKLNLEMGNFLSELFLWVIEISYLTYIKYFADPENVKRVVKLLIQTSYTFGATFTLALFIDFISILTFPISIFYHISCKLYSFQINVMVSLFYLFRGKKRNILRKRIDYKFFDLDQLLMGTLLFIILLFLFPTVLAFYSAYTTLRIIVLAVELLLESLIALINHFPLFALLLKLKDPLRIPGGIYYRFDEVDDNEIVLTLHNKPMPVGLMFRQYKTLMSSLQTNYLSPKALKHVLKGGKVIMQRQKLYSVLYSTLPDNPLPIHELYDKLINN